MYKRFLLVAVVVGCLPLAACGGNPKTYKVTGTVIWKGQPVADANVSFMAEGQSRPSTGKTNAQGKFTLSTFKSNDGALPGKNKATVTKVEAENMDPAAMAERMKGGAGVAPTPKALLPASAALDAGTYEVGPGKPTDIEIKLKDE